MTTTGKYILQAATTIAKTTPTAVGGEINVSRYDYLTLYFTYVNGDETGCNAYVYEESEKGGTDYQDITWSDASGTITGQVNLVYLGAASVSTRIVYDVRKINYIVVKQGGSDNDGTPTGTLAVDYTLTR